MTVNFYRLFSICFCFTFGLAISQAQLVSGTVLDENGVPLPGASVVIEGSDVGVSTDFDGNFSIQATQGDTLVFSYIGYSTQTIVVGEESSYEVILSLGDALDEVVVTSLGITRQKRELTYATQSIDTDGIDETRPDGNLVNALQGKVAGLSIQRGSTGVSSGSKVILRGNRSIAGSSQPLYIVDGVPLGGDISNLSPDDVASINVLRGANAAALYGARANNGAIIITTKSGTEGELRVNLNSTVTFDAPYVLYEYQNEYGQGSGGVHSSFSTDSWGPKLGGSQEHWSPSPEISGSIPFVANPNNVTDFFDTGLNISNNVSLTTGSAKTVTYFSYTNELRNGVVPGNDFENHSVTLKIDNNLLDEKLKLSSRVNFIKSTVNNQLSTWESFSNPLRHVYRLPRNIRTQDASIFEYVADDGSVRQNYWKPLDNGGANPYWTINRNLNEIIGDRVIGYASLSYAFSPEITVLVRTSIDNSSSSRENFFYNDSYIIAQNGNYQTSNSRNVEWNNDFLITWDKDFNDSFSANFNLGGNNRIAKAKGVNTNNAGLNAPNVFSLANAQNLSASQFINERQVNSLYAFGNLGYNNSVFLDLSYRSDWSSTLPVDNNRYDYFSVGASAVVSDLVSLPDALQFLKLRASYASVGNDTAPYSLSRLARLQPGGFIDLDPTAPASDLRPEKTKSIEFGIDSSFEILGQRVGVDFTYYKSNSVDQLFSQDVPVASGVARKFLNGGDIQNSGIETVVTTALVSGQNFTWETTTSFSANRSKVLDLAEGIESLSYGAGFLRRFQLDIGEPWGSIYSRGFERDAQGRVIMNDNGTPKLTSGQSVLVGNFNPDWLAGFLNSITYKNFNLRLLIDFRQGGKVVSFTRAILASDGLLAETAVGRESNIVFGRDVYTDETPATTPVPVDPETFWTSIGGRNAPSGEPFTDDASNIRVRELSLSYNVPQTILDASPFSELKLSLVGRNLLFLSNSASYDPELVRGTGIADDGIEGFSLPATRSVGLNLKLGF